MIGSHEMAPGRPKSYDSGSHSVVTDPFHASQAPLEVNGLRFKLNLELLVSGGGQSGGDGGDSRYDLGLSPSNFCCLLR